jgi:hypothetical protein
MSNNLDKVQAKGKLSLVSQLLVFLSALLFPLCILPVFAVHSSKFFEILGFSSIDGGRPGCAANSSLAAVNQCANWQMPGSIKIVGILLFIVILGFGLLLSYYTARITYREAKRFVNIRFVTALVSTMVTLLAYVLMRDVSQNHGSSNFGFMSVNLVNGHYVPAHVTTLGYGLTPAMFTFIAVAYVLPACISWHRFIFSQRHIGGQKKQALFQ